MDVPWLNLEVMWLALGSCSAFLLGYGVCLAVIRRSRARHELGDHVAEALANEAARVAEEKYRSIFENAVEGIFQTTPDGKYLSANPRLAKIYGYKSADALMTSLRDIERQLYVDPQRRAEFTRLMDEHDEIRDFESQIFRRDGSVIWISENARAIRSAAGRLLYYEGTVEDVTARKQAAGLRAEKEAAVAANQAKSAFLAHMSHEIRTPLNGVMGMLQLLAQSPLDERQTGYLAVARSSAENLLAIINDVLDFSKIEAGKLELERISFNLHQLLEEVTELFTHKAYGQGLELSCRAAPEVPAAVCGDPQRLRQVLINLIGNALKFTERGEVAVRADVIDPTADVPTVRLTVRDTGIGIPPERRDRLFAPFSQLDASTTRKYGGTGLGLAICRQIAELMDGQIGVECPAEGGSTFWLEVPLVKAEMAATAEPAPLQLSGQRVLAVDAQATSVAILRELFDCWQMSVIVATADEAPQRLQAASESGRPFALAILAHQPPQQDALDVARAIRQDATLDKIPLFALTDIHAAVDREPCEALRMAVISKPIMQSRLFDALVSALHQPIAKCNAVGAASPLASAKLPAATPVSESEPLCGIRLLVAEDNDINQLVTSEILRSAGLECDLVTTGRQAINALRRGAYDLVLMDCQMPELDGFEATREIRRLEAKSELPHASRGPIPIIALTANAVRGDREQCLAAGMTDYATKPVRREQLIATIHKHLPRTQPAPDNAAESEIATTATRGVPAPAVKPFVPVLDLDSLRDRCSGDEAFTRKLLQRFSERLPGTCRELASAIDGNDLLGARRLAHTLKGTAANLGAERIRAAAADLEQAIADDPPAAGRSQVARLALEVENCLDLLGELLENELVQA